MTQATATELASDSPSAAPSGLPDHVRIAIVGAGFGGLGMAIRLRLAGIEDFVILERADRVGGVWRANTYPGCACDVPSPLYSFSFAQNPEWSRFFAPQPEINRYLQDTAERFDVLGHVRFGCDVEAASWSEEDQHWVLKSSRGTLRARVLVSAMGPLTEPALPDVPGLEEFPGEIFHSAQWNHDAELGGKRVAVIGTGSSAIQFVPRIQPEVGSLHLFQRTPGWVLPHPNWSVGRIGQTVLRRVPALQRALRGAVYWAMEALVKGELTRGRSLKALEALARWNLRRQVADADLRRRLTPDFTIGCKRILASNTYYRALSAPNAEVLTGGVVKVRGSTLIAGDGSEREVDTIVLGTGYGILAGPAYAHIRGADGRSLSEVWETAIEGFLGSSITGFPNLFTIIGPNTGLGAGSMVYMIEAQIAYVIDALEKMEEGGIASVETRPEAQRRFNAEIQERMEGTVWTAGGCSSWYLDSSGCNRTIWPGHMHEFRRRTSSFDLADYEARLHEPAPGLVGAGAEGPVD